VTDAVKLPDAWLRGPVAGVPGHLVPAAHAFRQAAEDVERALADLPPDTLWLRPGGAASPGFHLKHLVGSTGRLLTYARGGTLSDTQKAQMAAESQGDPGESAASLGAAVVKAMEDAIEVLRATPPDSLLDAREVGKARLPTTVLGAIFHAAEHAQRHAGQLVTTVKVIRGLGLS
jgi:hypothetical protein